MSVPGNISVERGEKYLKISRRRFSCLAPFLFLIVTILNGGFLVFVKPFNVFTAMLTENGWFSALINLGYFTIVEVILLFFTYSFLSLMINKKVIKITDKKISLYDRPLPNFSGKSFELENISHFSSEKAISYSIQAVTKDDNTIILLFGLRNLEEASFILKNIEDYTGLKIKT